MNNLKKELKYYSIILLIIAICNALIVFDQVLFKFDIPIIIIFIILFMNLANLLFVMIKMFK